MFQMGTASPHELARGIRLEAPSGGLRYSSGDASTTGLYDAEPPRAPASRTTEGVTRLLEDECSESAGSMQSSQD
jgi:hypothetical protein